MFVCLLDELFNLYIPLRKKKTMPMLDMVFFCSSLMLGKYISIYV